MNDKVVIFRFNGVNYAEFQTFLMSTDCKAIDTNEDFSILGVVGTNLFQVYATNSSGMFVNFYTFPSALGMSYSNRAISMTPNGMKAVVFS